LTRSREQRLGLRRQRGEQRARIIRELRQVMHHGGVLALQQRPQLAPNAHALEARIVIAGVTR
jgi:hypothetical protein